MTKLNHPNSSSNLTEPFDAVNARQRGTAGAADRREDRALRRANGITVAIERALRRAGVRPAELHATSMALIRQVQAHQDADGAISKALGVRTVGINGTVAIRHHVVSIANVATVLHRARGGAR